MKIKLLAGLVMAAILILSGLLIYSKEKGARQDVGEIHRAMFYEKSDSGTVRCKLCPNRCMLSEGQVGICRSRKNINGDLYSLVYGKIASEHLDPIEKKPFFHFLPGSRAYSIATTGCNLRCKFCQNWQISQASPWEVPTKYMMPEEVVGAAKASGGESIAYTYNEPTIYYEYIRDIAKLAHERGLKNIIVSSGFINPEPLKELLPFVDAYKIDFKGFDEAFYDKMTNGSLAPVLETMKIIKEKDVWLEIVNLVIPGENDSDEAIKGIVTWIVNNLGPDVPLHFTRFHPDFKLQNTPPTPVDTLARARKIAMDAGIKFVYTGNVDDPDGLATYCPKSKERVIERKGMFMTRNRLKDGKCADGEVIPGVWK